MNYSEDEGLSFLDHLEELRSRIIIAIIALVLGTIIGFFFARYPLDLLARPLVRAQEQVMAQRIVNEIPIEIAADGTLRFRGLDSTTLPEINKNSTVVFYREGDENPVGNYQQSGPGVLFYRSPVDAFLIWLKASLVIGLVLAMPVILYQIYAFVAPGLLAHERRLVLPLILAGTILFPAGAVFAYFLLEVALLLFSTFTVAETIPINDANAYMGFALMMMLAFGATFEFPLVVILATRVGLVETKFLAERRKYVFVIMLIGCAIVTPPDVFTLAALTIPLYLLFEISLLVSFFLDRVAARKAAEESPDEDSRQES